MSPCQAGLGPSKITIGWFPGMSTGYLAKRTNIKYVSFGMKMLLYQKSPCITWNIPGLLTSHILPDNYHSLDKEADTVQSTCTYLEDDSNYFIRSLNTQYLLFSRYKILIKRTLSSWKGLMAHKKNICISRKTTKPYYNKSY